MVSGSHPLSPGDISLLFPFLFQFIRTAMDFFEVKRLVGQHQFSSQEYKKSYQFQ